MQVRYSTRSNGDRHTHVFDPVTGTGSQFNGHVPGGIIPHKMASVRKQMKDNSPHMDQHYAAPIALCGPKKPDLRIV